MLGLICDKLVVEVLSKVQLLARIPADSASARPGATAAATLQEKMSPTARNAQRLA